MYEKITQLYAQLFMHPVTRMNGISPSAPHFIRSFIHTIRQQNQPLFSKIHADLSAFSDRSVSSKLRRAIGITMKSLLNDETFSYQSVQIHHGAVPADDAKKHYSHFDDYDSYIILVITLVGNRQISINTGGRRVKKIKLRPQHAYIFSAQTRLHFVEYPGETCIFLLCRTPYTTSQLNSLCNITQAEATGISSIFERRIAEHNFTFHSQVP